MAFGPGEIMLLVPILLGFPIWGIIDAISRPASQWATARLSKGLWILIQIVFWVVGTVGYIMIAWPKLRAAGRTTT